MNVLQSFIEHFQNYVWLACIIVALIPTLEAKIAIPFVMNSSFFGQNALNAFSACLFAFLGSILPSIFIILLVRFCKNKTQTFLVSSKKFSIKINKINSQTSALKKYILLASFVAIPLPLTGVWTGSVIAGLSNLGIFKSFLSIIVGALISCLIMTIICIYFKNSMTAILLISLSLVILFLLVDIVINLFKKGKK